MSLVTNLIKSKNKLLLNVNKFIYAKRNEYPGNPLDFTIAIMYVKQNKCNRKLKVYKTNTI